MENNNNNSAASVPQQQDPQQPTDDGGWVGIFVRRPILALVLNLLIIIAGFAAYQGIEVRELPDVDRPVVTVRASYTGATPESIDSQITAVIESAVSRVQGVTSISSTSSYGQGRISIEFSSKTNLDTAAMDVRDAVASVVNQLPDDMEDEPRVANDGGSNVSRREFERRHRGSLPHRPAQRLDVGAFPTQRLFLWASYLILR